MNIEQINEALRRTGLAEFMVNEDTEPEHVRIVREAARRFVDGWETCPTCNGTGRELNYDGPDLTVDCPDCVDGMIPSPELVERSRFPVLDSIGMIASKWLRITHDEAMQRLDIQEAATIIAKAVLLASRREEA